MKAFVGLDLSLTNTGIAVITGDQKADYYSFGFSLGKDAGNYAVIKRYISLTHKIIETVKKYPDLHSISMENYGFGGPGLAVQCEFGGIVKSQIFLALKRVPLTLPSTVIRKLLLGDAKRQDIKSRVRESLLAGGYPPTDNHDQSDALAVAHVVRQLHMGCKNAYERKVLAGLSQQNFRG